MTATADELHWIGPDLLLWHAYDPASKTELFSTAVTIAFQTLLIDPIPLARPALAELLRISALNGIVITSANHPRAAAEFAHQFALPVFAHPHSYPGNKPPAFTPLSPGSKILDAVEVIAIEGAVAGEIALHVPGAGGSLVIGDALINFDSYGFTFLPAKYCTDHKQMRKSLHQLMACKFERMFFAHGTPILSNARARLEQLLANDA